MIATETGILYPPISLPNVLTPVGFQKSLVLIL